MTTDLAWGLRKMFVKGKFKALFNPYEEEGKKKRDEELHLFNFAIPVRQKESCCLPGLVTEGRAGNQCWGNGETRNTFLRFTFSGADYLLEQISKGNFRFFIPW